MSAKTCNEGGACLTIRKNGKQELLAEADNLLASMKEREREREREFESKAAVGDFVYDNEDRQATIEYLRSLAARDRDDEAYRFARELLKKIENDPNSDQWMG